MRGEAGPTLRSDRSLRTTDAEIWPAARRLAAQAEGWDLFNVGEPTMDLQRDDEPASALSSVLADDLDAWRWVYLVDSDLHTAAREAMRKHAPDRHREIEAYIDDLRQAAARC